MAGQALLCGENPCACACALAAQPGDLVAAAVVAGEFAKLQERPGRDPLAQVFVTVRDKRQVDVGELYGGDAHIGAMGAGKFQRTHFHWNISSVASFQPSRQR